MADAHYEAAIKETFETKPLRTVLMIDDQFPTFGEIARAQESSVASSFREIDTAVALYESFRERHMLCDIENVPDHLNLERIRKSDLVILDYHLGPTEGDNERAIDILRSLSTSKHFNTIVVYTAEPDLDGVWLDIVASLGGDWDGFEDQLCDQIKENIAELDSKDIKVDIPNDAIFQYARRRSIRDLDSGVRSLLQTELLENGVPSQSCGKIIEYFLTRELSKIAGKYKTSARLTTVGQCSADTRWVQGGNVFVAIKSKLDVDLDNAKDPAGIFDCLSSALQNWNPNLIQIILSEVQNVLESESLISGHDLFREPSTHAALWFYLLNALDPFDPSEPSGLEFPLAALLDRILDGIKRRLSSDENLLALSQKALLGEIRSAGWDKTNWPNSRQLGTHAINLSRANGETTLDKMLFRLNAFLSTEPFLRAHLTTGTLVKDRSTQECFVLASPACDMEPREPGQEQLWTNSIHPLRPVICVHLHPEESIGNALSSATQGRHIFLERDAEQFAFKYTKGGDGGRPSYEVIMVRDAGRVETNGHRRIFKADRLAGSAGTEPEIRSWTDREFEVIGQLRQNNANRILQFVTQHLSRVGLDFYSLG